MTEQNSEDARSNRIKGIVGRIEFFAYGVMVGVLAMKWFAIPTTSR